MDGVEGDNIPRENTSLEQLAKLKPVFDKESGSGSLTAGNSSLLTDGAAGLWVCGSKAKEKFSDNSYTAQLVDWEIAAVNIEKEGLHVIKIWFSPLDLKIGRILSFLGFIIIFALIFYKKIKGYSFQKKIAEV